MPVRPSDAAPNTLPDARRSRLGRWGRRLAAGAAVVAALVLAAFTAGFAWFVWRVPDSEVALTRNADGIVVLTGGRERITDGLRLLAAGRGKRLLITGVHRTTSVADIARQVPAYDSLVTCCVDLDHSAVNTVGNALQTRQWATSRGFHSLIVVTSNYHMLRTMAELERKLSGIALIPFPVVTERLKSEPWWTPMTARLLAAEYVKYILAQLRIRFESPLADTGALARGGRG
jgi:uncharacterized SAM-binding protein YcdF (DUF218 family)